MEYTRIVEIKTRNDGKIRQVQYLVPYQFDEIVNHRIFDTLQDAEYTFLALDRGKSAWALSHGLACPVDTKNAIKKIEALEKY